MVKKLTETTKQELIDFALSLFVTTVLLYFFTNFFQSMSKISGDNFIVLVAMSFIVGFVVLFRRKIKEIDLLKMRLTLEKTQKTKDEIDKIALSLVKFIASLSSYSSGSWLNRKKLNDEIEKFLGVLKIEPLEEKKILELPRIVEKMMKKGKESLTPEENKIAGEMFNLKEKTNI